MSKGGCALCAIALKNIAQMVSAKDGMTLIEGEI